MTAAGNRTPTLILASSSPRRQQLIASLGLPVIVRPSDADESTPDGWTPQQVAERLALRKARTVREASQDDPGLFAVVVGSDTIVVLDGDILGKPADADDAFRMLTRLSGRRHEVYTGVCCIDLQSGRESVAHRKTTVHMRPLTPDQIRRYVATGEPLDKAGAYGIQGLGAVLVDAVEGCYFTVVGLPLSLLAEQLETFGVSIP